MHRNALGWEVRAPEGSHLAFGRCSSNNSWRLQQPKDVCRLQYPATVQAGHCPAAVDHLLQCHLQCSLRRCKAAALLLDHSAPTCLLLTLRPHAAAALRSDRRQVYPAGSAHRQLTPSKLSIGNEAMLQILGTFLASMASSTPCSSSEDSSAASCRPFMHCTAQFQSAGLLSAVVRPHTECAISTWSMTGRLQVAACDGVLHRHMSCSAFLFQENRASRYTHQTAAQSAPWRHTLHAPAPCVPPPQPAPAAARRV